DIALAQRGGYRAGQLVAVEGHLAARLLDHHQLAQLHPFEGSEAAAAGIADPAAADGAGILGGPAVLDLRILVSAIGAAHQPCPPHGNGKAPSPGPAPRPPPWGSTGDRATRPGTSPCEVEAVASRMVREPCRMPGS